MDFEGFGTSNSPGLGMSTTHKRSKSFSNKKQLEDNNLDNFFVASNPLKLGKEHLNGCVKTKKKQPPNAVVRNSLRQEILQLERRLEDQVAVRRVLEKALGYTSSCHDSANEISVPKDTDEGGMKVM